MAMSQFALRGAIALNNMAATMMERCCYRQAFITLKNAVSAMTLANDTSADSRYTVLMFLKQAYKRTSCQQPYPTSLSIPVTSIAHDAKINFTEGLHKYSAPKYHIVRIEVHDVDILDCNDSSGLATIIMLYNFGVAHLCRAQVLERQSQARKLRSGGLKLLSLCRNLLIEYYDECDDPVLLSRYMLILSHTLETLASGFLGDGQVDEARACKNRLTLLKKVVSEYHSIHSTLNAHSQVKAAPAA